MTEQESQLIDGLVQRVQRARPASKDSEAEQRLQAALGADPDALYILAQTVIVQQYALDQAQKQLADVRQQIAALEQQQRPAPEQHTSFLGSLFGAGHSSASPAVQATPIQQYVPVNTGAAWGQASYGLSQAGGLFGGGGGGFLQGALQTAAGVAAGEMAFRGIEDLMHGFGQAAGYGSDRMMEGGLGGSEAGNNYLGSEDEGSRASLADRLQTADGNEGLSSDLEDRRGFSGSTDDDGGGPSDDAADFAGDGGDDSSSDFSSNDDGSY